MPRPRGGPLRLSAPRHLGGGRFSPRDIPGGDGAAYVPASIASIPREVETLVAVRASYEQVAEALSWVDHTPVDIEADSYTIRLTDQIVAVLPGPGLAAGA